MVSYKALNTSIKTVAFELQQSLGELYFRQAFAIGKHLASQQDGIVGYGYAGKAVARTESGFTYTFECGGQGEFLQVVAIMVFTNSCYSMLCKQ